MLERRASRIIEPDHLPVELCRLRETIASWLGLADPDDPRITWRYLQTRVLRRNFGVRLRIDEER